MLHDLDFRPNASILKYLGGFDDYSSCNVDLNFVLLGPVTENLLSGQA
jgi:hypothetical protein